jgi:hypothetical protein
MSFLARSRRVLVVGIVAAAAALAMTHVANAAPAAPTVPDAIEVPAGNKLFLVGHAKGVQIYKCDGKVWTFVEPRADLVDDNGKLIVTHFAGPTWKAVTDDSEVVGAVVVDDETGERASVVVDRNAIPWLLLRATSTTGDGLLSDTTFIQRVETKGGTAPPAAACKPATEGKVVEVPYKADYYFYREAAA